MRRWIFPCLVGIVFAGTGCRERARVTKVSSAALVLPSGFVEEALGGTWNQAVGLTFTAAGDLIVWEKAGRVWRVAADGTRDATPLLDIHEEVGDWRDHGMLGLALHPNFLSNGYLYVLYAVDYHHLNHFGTPAYDPGADEYFVDTQVRLTRYQARTSDGLRSVDLDTREVLMGETKGSGCALHHQSHGAGSIVFGTDGTLLVTCGDGASYDLADGGGDITGSSNTALPDGIITPSEDVGAFRAQLVNSTSGKVLRLDASTGAGVPSNPFYDPSAPFSARSRVWALGLRNPFRAVLRPGTGGHDPAEGNPGTLYVGDVGWDQREELDVVKGPGANFGWPIYEGLALAPLYADLDTANRDAPNPLFGITPPAGAQCTQEFVPFERLLVEDTSGALSFPNPCDPTQQLPPTLRLFEHARPVLDWQHNAEEARVPSYDAQGNASSAVLGAGAPVSGASFVGTSAIGGVWYTGTDFPASYRNSYFLADFAAGWVKNLVFDGQDRLLEVRDFSPAGNGAIVAMATHPTEGGLYYITYANVVRRIRYTGGGNRSPTALASSDLGYGPSPLQVRFDGSQSHDPELGTLSYQWDFGDGSPAATGPNPIHTFDSGGAAPRTYVVTLRVSDVSGAQATSTLPIVVNNTPPSVSLMSPVNGDVFSVDADTSARLMAVAADAEQSGAALSCTWQTTLFHNAHSHPEPVSSGCMQVAVISPVPCDDEDYFYGVAVTVSDGAGLATTESSVLYPDCTPGALEPNGTVTDRTPRLEWRRVQGADAYEVMVNDARQQSTLVRSFTPAQLGCSTGPRCSFTIAAPLALGTASFQVRARNPVAGLRAWSKLATFTVTHDGQPPPSGSNLAVLGTPIVSVTAPGGGGSTDITIIRDGVKPAVNSTSDEQQYDTYHGTAPSAAEWVGYTFGASYALTSLVFQEGKHFGDGGWFDTLAVQVHRDGAWVDASGLVVAPAYPGDDGIHYQSFTLTFDAITGDGIRLYGAPGGSADFISIAELEVYGQDVTP